MSRFVYLHPDLVAAAVSGGVNSFIMLTDRWTAVRGAYRKSGASIRFVTYPRIGHGVDERIFHGLTAFFQDAARRVR